jgi:hypothetical protein
MDMANELRNILIVFTYFSTFFALQGWAGLVCGPGDRQHCCCFAGPPGSLMQAEPRRLATLFVGLLVDLRTRLQVQVVFGLSQGKSLEGK